MWVVGILLDRDIVRLASLFEVATVEVLPALRVGRHRRLSTRSKRRTGKGTLSVVVAFSQFLAAP